MTANHVVVGEAVLDRLRTLAATGGQVGYHSVDDGDVAVIDDSADGLMAHVVSEDAAGLPVEPVRDLLLVVNNSPQATPLTAFSWHGSGRRPIGVTVTPSSGLDVFDRLRGIFESSLLRDRCVLIVGLGSGGSYILRELVRAGVGAFVLIDHDRLEAANVCRHELGLSDVGRLKVNALYDYVLDRNPQATVQTHSLYVDGTTVDQLRSVFEQARPDLVVCGTDNRESRLLVNRLSIRSDTVALYGGVRRRAYGGQVLRVVPGLTPCYQCFVSSLPGTAADREISSPSEARGVAYSDRPVEPEPGLSTDIAPIALFMAKLAILELTGGHASPVFDSLREDLVAPWFFWLNRREPETPFAAWPPLLDQAGGPGVLRWIGQFLDRDERCPACGDLGVKADEEDVAEFLLRS